MTLQHPGSSRDQPAAGRRFPAWKTLLCRGLLSYAVVALLATSAAAQTLTGNYSYTSPAGVVTLTLEQVAGQRVTGTMRAANGATFRLEGEVADGRATGAISSEDGTGFFAAGFQGETLLLVVAEINPVTQQPDLNQGWRLDFRRTSGEASRGATGADGTGMGTQAGGAAQAPAQPAALPGVTSDSPLAREWLAHLRGRKVTYLSSYSSSGGSGYGGYSEQWEAHLCSDMTFVYHRSSSVSIDVGASAHRSSRSTVRGTWRVVTQGEQAAVEYRTSEGELDYVPIAMQNGRTMWNGQRVFVTRDSDVCQ
jgi:hypothetical protein